MIEIDLKSEKHWHLPDMDVALKGKLQAYHHGRQVILSGPDDVVAEVAHAIWSQVRTLAERDVASAIESAIRARGGA